MLTVFNFDKSARNLTLCPPWGKWKKILCSSDSIWGGQGSMAQEEVQSGGGVRVCGFSAVTYGEEGSV